MRETAFTLAYGHKAMPPIEVKIPTYKVQHLKLDFNDKRLEEHLNLLEEIRCEAEVTMVVDKKRAERCFNRKVCLRSFKIGDLVLK